MRDRELLSDLARLAYETIKQLMGEAAGDAKARPERVNNSETPASCI